MIYDITRISLGPVAGLVMLAKVEIHSVGACDDIQDHQINFRFSALSTMR